jgi:hypothetical protein
MNVKIQGGGAGAYANTGSSVGVTNYLEHEELDRIKNGKERENFFTHDKEQVSAREATYKIDNNKAKLSKKDSKFFVVTVSPSETEIKAMGATPEERSASFKKYINEGIMERYAENFGKELHAKDMLYYAKIHHERGSKQGEQMHAHIIISRKDITNKIKLSPQTNHRGKSRGAIKSGFDRTEFFNNAEKTFDRDFNHSRDFKESFEFQNTMKNGNVESIRQLPERETEFVQEQEQEREQEQKQTMPGEQLDQHQEQEQTQEKDYSQEYDHEEEYEQEQEQTQSKSRGVGR